MKASDCPFSQGSSLPVRAGTRRWRGTQAASGLMHVLEESIVKLSKVCLRLVGLQPQAQEAVDLDGDGQADFVEPPPAWLYYTRGAVFWVLALLLMQARPTAAASCHPRPVLLLLSPPAAAACSTTYNRFTSSAFPPPPPETRVPLRSQPRPERAPASLLLSA